MTEARLSRHRAPRPAPRWLPRKQPPPAPRCLRWPRSASPRPRSARRPQAARQSRFERLLLHEPHFRAPKRRNPAPIAPIGRPAPWRDDADSPRQKEAVSATRRHERSARARSDQCTTPAPARRDRSADPKCRAHVRVRKRPEASCGAFGQLVRRETAPSPTRTRRAFSPHQSAPTSGDQRATERGEGHSHDGSITLLISGRSRTLALITERHE